MPTKVSQTKMKPAIVVALIGLAGVILAALIGIAPTLVDITNKVRTESSPTSASYSTFDDPTGVFSIDYPSGYSLSGRIVSETAFYVAIAPIDEKTNGVLIRIIISKYGAPASQSAEALIQMITKSNEQSVQTGQSPKEHIVSSEKTDKGYQVHYFEYNEFGVAIHHYEIVESDSGVFARVELTVAEVASMKLTESEIERILSSFHWTPLTASQYFQQ